MTRRLDSNHYFLVVPTGKLSHLSHPKGGCPCCSDWGVPFVSPVCCSSALTIIVLLVIIALDAWQPPACYLPLPSSPFPQCSLLPFPLLPLLCSTASFLSVFLLPIMPCTLCMIVSPVLPANTQLAAPSPLSSVAHHTGWTMHGCPVCTLTAPSPP